MQRHCPAVRVADLTRGPGRLCAALGIGRELSGEDLCTSDRLWLERGSAPAGNPGEHPHRPVARPASASADFSSAAVLSSAFLHNGAPCETALVCVLLALQRASSGIAQSGQPTRGQFPQVARHRAGRAPRLSQPRVPAGGFRGLRRRHAQARRACRRGSRGRWPARHHDGEAARHGGLPVAISAA